MYTNAYNDKHVCTWSWPFNEPKKPASLSWDPGNCLLWPSLIGIIWYDPWLKRLRSANQSHFLPCWRVQYPMERPVRPFSEELGLKMWLSSHQVQLFPQKIQRTPSFFPRFRQEENEERKLPVTVTKGESFRKRRVDCWAAGLNSRNRGHDMSQSSTKIVDRHNVGI